MTMTVMMMILTRLTADPPTRRVERPNQLRGLHSIGVKPGLSTPSGSPARLRKTARCLNCTPPDPAKFAASTARPGTPRGGV